MRLKIFFKGFWKRHFKWWVWRIQSLLRYDASYWNNVYIIVQASASIQMKEHFATWKVKFDMDFDIKPIMTEEEKIAEHK